MRVAVISAEAVPYSKTGGLGDVAGALPKAFGNGRRRRFPYYTLLSADKGRISLEHCVDDLWVDWRGGAYQAKVFYSEANGSPTFLIDAPSLFSPRFDLRIHRRLRAICIFQPCRSRASETDRRRSGYCPSERLALWVRGRRDRRAAAMGPFWRNTRTVFSIHNMAYQGGFGLASFGT